MNQQAISLGSFGGERPEVEFGVTYPDGSAWSNIDQH
jgi:hypothetical protein